MTTYDVAVIGGGIIGSSVAFELAAEKLRVTLLDRQKPGLEASWAAAGMLSPGPHSPADDPLVPFARESFHLYPKFVEAIEDASGMKIEFARPGALEIFSGAGAEAERDRFLAIHRRFALDVESVSIDHARKLEPSLGPIAQAAAWLSDEATVAPRSLMNALLEGARNRGVELRADSPVSSLFLEGQRCAGVSVGAERLTASLVVLAAGCYSGQAFNGNRSVCPIPTKPVRGQMVALRHSGLNLQRVLRSSKGYVVPRRDGRVIAGSTLEDAGFEKHVTPEGVNQIMEAARELVPALSGAEIVDTWSGLRPGTPDNLPIIGPTDIEGLFVATGHYRNGILLAPATAKAMKQLILGSVTDPAVDRNISSTIKSAIAPFTPLRFAHTTTPPNSSLGTAAHS